MTAPNLDLRTRQVAALAAIDDPVMAAVLVYVRGLERYIDAAESQALEVLRVASLPAPAPQWPRYGRSAA
jgi:hypothetical protein